MTLLGDRLAVLRVSGTKALVPYVVGGFPDRSASIELIAGIGEIADVVEVGLPYSDPLMDGPVIENAARQAILGGTGPLDALGLPFQNGSVRVAMTYYNPIHRCGEPEFCDRLVSGGFQGLIVPDIPAEASSGIREAAAARDLAWIPLIAPTSPPARVEQAVAGATGFVYAVSTLGVTGLRQDLSRGAAQVVARCRDATDVPVYLGIGISTPEQARTASEIADGVVVGSALVKIFAEQGLEAAIAFIRDIRHSLTVP